MFSDKPVDKTQLDSEAISNFIEAVINQEEAKVRAYVDSGGIVNIDIIRSNSFSTPIGIAVNSLNYEICKILLEAGADPNFEKRCSLIELLMCHLGIIELQKLVPQVTKAAKSLKSSLLPPQNYPVIKPEISAKVANILDLLLCFGIKVDFTWSTNFNKALQEVKREVVTLDKTANEYNMLFNRRTAYNWGALVSNFAPHCIRAKNELTSFVEFIEKLPEFLNKNSSDISIQMQKYHELFKSTGLLSTLINLVLSYGNANIIAQVCSKRLAESKNILFWSQETPAASVKAAPGASPNPSS